MKRILKTLLVKRSTQPFRDAKETSWSETFHALARRGRGMSPFVLKEIAKEKTLCYSKNYDCGLHVVLCFELWHTKTKLWLWLYWVHLWGVITHRNRCFSSYAAGVL
jgi:hypothetical protein